MPSRALPIEILLVRSWLLPWEPIRSALHGAGFVARFHRVDIEPALAAALTRDAYDVVILDPRIPGLTRELVQARIAELRPGTPLVLLGRLDDLGVRIAAALDARRN
jgi:hypothetical protein